MGKSNNGFTFEINLDSWKKRDMDAWNEAQANPAAGNKINMLCAKAVVKWSLESDPKNPDSYDELTIPQIAEISFGIREAILNFFRIAQEQSR